MKRVAVCSYWYPPMQTIASLRVGKFVKYLPEFGWEPFVFTVAPRTNRYTRAGELPDEGLPDHVSRVPDPSVHALVDRFWPNADAPGGVPSVDRRWHWPRRLAKRAYDELLRFPDESWPWLLHYPRIRRDVARVEPGVILSSSPPATTHLLARRLSRDLGVPWVADFRDPWSHNYRLTRSSIFRGAERRLERRVVSSVAALTTVSPGFRDLLVSLHAKPTFIVPNGFDEEPTPASRAGSGHETRAVFTYTGLLYDTTAVPLLFEAIDRLVDGGRMCARRAVVQFYGRNQAVALEALRRFPRVRPLVELHGEVSHERALAAQQAATALLLLEPPEGWALSLTPAKLFEYVVAGRPIIATGMPGGEVDRLLRDTRTGTLVSTAEALADLLAMTAGRRHRGDALVPDADRSVIAMYSRRRVTARLAEVLDGVVRTSTARRAASALPLRPAGDGGRSAG
ncbi:MAG: glycosyltransferase [Acidobacteria bacterium]|nr:glycosyltransferase [Acidobacteriota bacterium]